MRPPADDSHTEIVAPCSNSRAATREASSSKFPVASGPLQVAGEQVFQKLGEPESSPAPLAAKAAVAGETM